MKTYQNQNFDEERALYGVKEAEIVNCTFAGPADGESAFKEAENIVIKNCGFKLRYPFWHVNNARLINSTMSEDCRAALWYDKDISLINCELDGIKAVRECRNVIIDKCRIKSMEFGWKCNKVSIRDTELESEYPFLFARDMKLTNFKLKGKYSFQYVENIEIRDSYLDTKDAFWHSKNVTVYDSVVKGEYLGWYSENLKLVRCRIIGTQPLCYAKGLVLEDCEMTGCDLSFEKSEVNAEIKGNIDSIKNPEKGYIYADSIGEIISDDNGFINSEVIIKVHKKNAS